MFVCVYLRFGFFYRFFFSVFVEVGFFVYLVVGEGFSGVEIEG